MRVKFWRIGLMLALIPFAALAGEGGARLLTVQGEAVSRVIPEVAVLTVTVREENASLKTAKEKHDAKLHSVLKLAEGMGIAKDKLQASHLSIAPQYDYSRDNGRPTLRGYEVQTGLTVKMKDPAKVSEFLNGVVSAGIDSAGNINYVLEDERKVKDNTLVLAIQHAHEKAERLAAAAGVTLGKPAMVQEYGVTMDTPSPPRPMMMKTMAMETADMATAPALPSGLVEIRQTVTVAYTIE